MTWHTHLLDAIRDIRRVPFSTYILIFLIVAPVGGLRQAYRIIRAPSLDEWVEVPATVDEANIDTRPPSKPGRSSPIEYAVIKYSYRYLGEDHHGSKIWFSYQSKKTEFEWVGILRKAKNRGATVPCFVNPKNPSEAILSRERSPRALLGWIAFALIGPGLLVLFITGRRLFTKKSPRQPSEIGWDPKKGRSASGFD